MRPFAFVLLAAVLAGCPPAPTSCQPPSPQADAAPPDGDACERACSNIKALGCPEGEPKTGESCVMVCRHTQVTGLTDLQPECLAAARSVDDVRACHTLKCKQP